MLLRHASGLSQREMGRICGVSYATVGKWERGESTPGADLIFAIARALSVACDFLLRPLEAERVFVVDGATVRELRLTADPGDRLWNQPWWMTVDGSSRVVERRELEQLIDELSARRRSLRADGDADGEGRS